MVMGLISAGIGALGSALGGSKKSTSQELPRWLRQDRRGFGSDMEALYGNPGNFPQYPGSSPTSPANPYEMATMGAYGNLAGQAGNLGDWYTNSLAGGMQNNPNAAYAGGFAGAPSMWNAAAAGGAPQVGAPNIDPNLGMYGSTAGINADPNQAINQMLSGQVDTTGFNTALTSAYEPMLKQFNERVLPGVLQADDAYSGGQGGSGKTKIAQRLGEDLGRAMTSTAGGLGYSAYQDALNRRDQGAGLATNANLAMSGQNLQGAGLGQQLGFQNAGNQMTAGLANQSGQLSYMDSLARGGAIGSGAASSFANSNLGYASQIPNAYNLYAGAPGAYGAAGSLQRSIQDPQYANQFAREQYTNNLPFMMGNQYGDLLAQLSGTSGMTTSQNTQPANPWGAAAMGGLYGWQNAPQQVPTSPPPYGPPAPNTQSYGSANNWIFGGPT